MKIKIFNHEICVCSLRLPQTRYAQQNSAEMRGNMKKSILLLTGIICLCGFLVGCGNNYNKTATDDESPIQNSISGTEENSLTDNAPVVEDESQTDNSNIANAKELEETFGILISLPENSTWIAEVEY
ncbi:MAG: hypothetical protein NC407_07985, partial [Lachnoclostridium sp.]|nr:hypothetical protein [Lachnoclostridium sp.]